jgi:hypothetical protein
MIQNLPHICALRANPEPFASLIGGFGHREAGDFCKKYL